MRWRAAEFEGRFSDRPPADLGAVDFGEPLEGLQLGVAVAAIFGRLANASRNACGLEPLRRERCPLHIARHRDLRAPGG
jgi:hypothetical protein